MAHRNPRRIDPKLLGSDLGQHGLDALPVRLDANHKHHAAIGQHPRRTALEAGGDRCAACRLSWRSSCTQNGRVLSAAYASYRPADASRVRRIRAGHGDQQALKAALDAWFDEVRKAKWSNTADIKRLYASASIVSSDRIVFNIRGNAYRLVVAVDFEKGIVWIKWLGTHRDYDRIDVKEVNYG